MTRADLISRVRHAIIMGAVSLLVAACVLFIGDYARVRYKAAKNQEPFGSVKVQTDYAVKQKSGKVEYYFDQQQIQPCSHSLFPQMGYTPCWYLQRKANKENKI